MPVIRPYISETSAQAAIPGRRATVEDFGGQGLAQVGRALSGVVGFVQQQEEDQEVSDVRRRMAQARTDLTETWINTRLSAAPGDLTVADSFSKQTGAYFEQMRGTIKTDAGKRVFEQAQTELSGGFRTHALEFQVEQAGVKAKMDFTALRDSNARTLAMDPSQYEAIVAQDKSALEKGEGFLGRMTPLDRQALGADTFHVYARAAATAVADRSPAAFLRAVKPDAVLNQFGVPTGGAVGGAGFGASVDFVLRMEGGYVAKDGKSGAPANFGINQQANPDVNVAGLTKEQAVQLYKDRYWDKIGAGSLAPPAALVAFDAAVNQGPGVAKTLIKQSGGDPVKMVALRRQMYTDLAENDPEHAKSLKGWLVRMDALEKQLPAVKQVSVADSALEKGTALKADVPGFNELPFNEQLQLIRHAETRAEQTASTARATMSKRMQDIGAEALATGNVTNAPTSGELTALYGPDEGARMFDEVQKAKKLGADMQLVRGMSPQAQADLLARYTPVGGEGFAAAAEKHGRLNVAITTARKQRDTDPAAYVYSAVPEVKAAMDVMLSANDPTAKRAATQKYATVALAEQKRLGVVEPALLPKNMEDAIVRSFSNQQQGGQNAANLVRDLQNSWGDNFARVYEQLAPKLPAAALVIPGMDDAPAALLAEAAKLKPVELWAGTPDDAKKQVDAKLVEAMSQYQQTIIPLAGGARTYSVYQEQAAALAAMYVRNGDKPAAAANRAFNEMVGKNYTFAGGERPYRIPKVDENRAPVNSDLVEAGAKIMLRNLAELPLQVPKSSTPGVTTTAARAALVRALESKAHWVTPKGDKGVALYYGGSAVLDVSGEPIFMTWGELQQKAGAAGADRKNAGVDALRAQRSVVQASGDREAVFQLERDIAAAHRKSFFGRP